LGQIDDTRWKNILIAEEIKMSLCREMIAILSSWCKRAREQVIYMARLQKKYYRERKQLPDKTFKDLQDLNDKYRENILNHLQEFIEETRASNENIMIINYLFKAKGEIILLQPNDEYQIKYRRHHLNVNEICNKFWMEKSTFKDTDALMNCVFKNE
jgi:hypothetical protein